MYCFLIGGTPVLLFAADEVPPPLRIGLCRNRNAFQGP